MRFRIVSSTSISALALLENLEVDAALSYIENEPIGKVRTVPLYNENYRLLTSPDGMFGDRKKVTWKEVGQVPLCLLTSDMQNRRIIDRALRSVGVEATPTLTSNSIIVLYTHVKTGRWASVMPAKLAETLGFSGVIRSCRLSQCWSGCSAARPDNPVNCRARGARDRTVPAGLISHRIGCRGLAAALGIIPAREPQRLRMLIALSGAA